MKIQILFFGILAEKAGTSSIEFENINNTNLLINKINKQINGLTKLNFTISLNQQIIHTNKKLKDGDIVALLPPFSGG